MGIITPISSLEDITRFNVVKEPVFDSQNKRIEGLFSLMRDDTRQHIGVCKGKYRPIQIDEMLDILDTSTSQLGNIKHTGYITSNNGRRVVIQSEIDKPLNISNDQVNGVFFTVIDNTGMNANRVIPSTIRLICTNQLHLVKRHAGRVDGLRHAATFNEKVIHLTNTIRQNIQAINNFSQTAETLRSTKFSDNEMLQLVEKLLPSAPGKEDSSQLLNKRADIIQRFFNGSGNEGKTRWDALNAFTEFESSKKFSAEKFVRTLTTPTLSNQALDILVR